MNWHRWECDVTGDRYPWHCICHPDAVSAATFRWVNEEKKVVWWEVPRAGSDSIRKTIMDIDNNPEWRMINQLELEMDLLPYGEYYNFAVVRNPWDRVASCYHLYTTYEQGGWGSRRISECKLLFYDNKDAPNLPNFGEFVERMFDEGSRNHQWFPVSSYVPSEDADYELQTMDADDLTQEWKAMVDLFEFAELELSLESERPNETSYQEIYADWPGTKELVEQYYEEDIRRFKFEF